MKDVINLILDLVDVCYKNQKKLEKELIDLPEYREWSQYFIEGKSCLKIPSKKRKSIINSINNSRIHIDNNINNSSIKTK